MTQTPPEPAQFTPAPPTSPSMWRAMPPGALHPGASWQPLIEPRPPAAPPPPTRSTTTIRPPGTGRRWVELSVTALLAAVVAGGSTYAVVQTTSAPASQPPQTSSAAPVIQAAANAPDWAATAKAVSPSAVAITITGAQAGGEGSGVIIDNSGHVLTNNHVATGAGSRAQLTVTLDDGRSFEARIVGTDPATDLAVLQIQNAPQDLTPITFGDSSALAVGQPVMAIGNPLGLAGTVTTGIVSALDRPVRTGHVDGPRGRAGGDTVVTNAIQTSAAINPGNSGGALVTADGRLVGINSAIASLGSANGPSGNIGIGFAIPVDAAKAIADQLISTGVAKHAYLGVSTADGVVSDGASERNAAIIEFVGHGTPAADAGLRSGDAVVAVDGDRVNSSLSLVASIRERQPDETITLSVIRDGQQQEITVTLTTRAES